jgi:hypothetical protein
MHPCIRTLLDAEKIELSLVPVLLENNAQEIPPAPPCCISENDLQLRIAAYNLQETHQ